MKKTATKIKIKSVPPFLKWHAPTDPLKQYFDPSKTDSEVIQFSDSLNEILRFGTHILSWFRQEYSDSKFCEAASGLYVEQLQRIDALAGMFRSGGYSSSPVILRSMVEILLQLKYLMHSDSDRKGLSIQFMGKIRRIEFLKELQESTDNGKRIRDLLREDKSGGEFELGGKNIESELIELEKEISSTDYADVFKEYTRMTTKNDRRFEWYSMFNGPNELRELSRKVGETGIYYLSYKKFNDYVHGTQWFRGEQYWKKQGVWKYSLDVRPLESAPLFNESFLVAFRTLEFLLSHVHIEPTYWRDWFFSCKLIKLPGFENFVMNAPDGQAFDVELA